MKNLFILALALGLGACAPDSSSKAPTSGADHIGVIVGECRSLSAPELCTTRI